MVTFQPEQIITTETGVPVKIIKKLGEGGQGYIYLVEYEGKRKVLKWYRVSGLSDAQAVYCDLKNKVQRKSPHEVFLWPEALVRVEECFGYVMDPLPEGYVELSRYKLAKDVSSSFAAAVEACLRIVCAFRALHNHGYSYQNLNEDMFFIHPETGDVRIYDCDAVTDKGVTDILGESKYMAPERVTGKSTPNASADLFSLSVILFLILCVDHPLEGRRWVSYPCLTPAAEKQLYGENPVFIFDPEDTSNAAVPGVNNNAIRRWRWLPDHMKEAFLKAFSKEAMLDPNRRLQEKDWLGALVRFRSEIVRCGCRNEVFITNVSSPKCDACGKQIAVSHTIRFAHYDMTAAHGSRIYRCQLGVCNADEALKAVGIVMMQNNDPKALFLQNLTDQIFEVTTPSGNHKVVAPKGLVPFVKGLVIKVYGAQMELW